MSNKTLLWLEDRPKTVEEQKNYAETQGFLVEQVGQLSSFREVLENKQLLVKGIVLDVMLSGIYDLDELGPKHKHLDTKRGYETGWLVLEHYLRRKDSPFKDIPVLVLSVLNETKEKKDLLKRLETGGAPIDFISKGVRRHDGDWNKQFRDWINNLGTKQKMG